MCSRRHWWRPVFRLLAVLLVAGSGATAADAAAPLSWRPAVPSDAPGPGLTAVDCPSASLCVAADGRGGALSTTGPLRGGAWRAGAPIDSLGRLNALSCPSAAGCFAVGVAGNLEYGPSSSRAWKSWNIDLLTPLNAISCPTISLCVAVDDAGRVLVSTTPRASLTWSLPMAVDSPNRLDALSCPTVRLCVAVDGAGNVLVSTNPTVMGTWHATPLARTGALSAVSCTIAGLCVAVARDGSVYATADVAGGSVTWSATALDPGGVLAAVSCSRVGLCVALDQSGNAFESDNPASGRPFWLRTAIGSVDGPTGASCRPVRFCLVVDSAGNAIAGTLPGPTVVTGAATVASQTTAQVGATVDANDANVVGCRFDYGLTTAYGRRVACSPMPRAIGGSRAVSAQLNGLFAATTYHFRVTATNGVATAAGADALLTTPAPLTASPSLIGTPAVGFVLACKANIPAATTPTPPTTVAYAWLADTTPIANAAAATHLVAPAEASHQLRCQVAISGDGATTTATSGFVSIPSQTQAKVTESRVGAVTHRSTWVRVPVRCSPQAVGTCTLTLRLTAVKITQHRRRTVTVGFARFILEPGATRIFTIWLNTKGRRLLKKRHRFRTTLTVTGTVVGTLTGKLLEEPLVVGARKSAAAPGTLGSPPASAVRGTCPCQVAGTAPPAG
jgi:hypothetical protein